MPVSASWKKRCTRAELAANEVRMQRGALADRLREDYGIELAALERDFTADEERQREEVQREIEELRQKITNLGNVNLEALEELEQLEARHKTLSDQHGDLSSAKASLEKIIERINCRQPAAVLRNAGGRQGPFPDALPRPVRRRARRHRAGRRRRYPR